MRRRRLATFAAFLLGLAVVLAAWLHGCEPAAPPPSAAPQSAAPTSAAPQSVAAPPTRPKLADLAQPTPGVEAPAEPPPIQRLDEHRVQIGKVLVDRRLRRVEAPGRLNMTEGILEYYAVSSNGKLHESVLELFIQPSHLHVGLLLAGLDPNVYRDTATGMRQVVKAGGRVKMFVEWTNPKTGARKREPAESWLYDRQKKRSPPAQDWAFLGSSFWNGRYSADGGRSVIALIPDESCVVGVVGNAGNPYQGEALGFEVNTKGVPPVDTPVTLVLEAAPEPGAAPASMPASGP